jgi:hypothetical protein
MRTFIPVASRSATSYALAVAKSVNTSSESPGSRKRRAAAANLVVRRCGIHLVQHLRQKLDARHLFFINMTEVRGGKSERGLSRSMPGSTVFVAAPVETLSLCKPRDEQPDAAARTSRQAKLYGG